MRKYRGVVAGWKELSYPPQAVITECKETRTQNLRHHPFVWSRAERSKPLTLTKEVACFVADRMGIILIWDCIWMQIPELLNNSYIFLEWTRQGDIIYEVSYTYLWVTRLWNPVIHSRTLETTRKDLLKLKSLTNHPTHSATKNMWEDFFAFLFSLFFSRKRKGMTH